MPYLMTIGFDNSSRLARRIYYFMYKGVRFKLIQTSREWTDVLLSIIDDDRDNKAQEKVFAAAAEFLTALSWENNSLVKFNMQGGRGIKKGFQLKNAQCSIFSFPKVANVGRTLGYNLTGIPKIESKEQRIALILYREAKSSNNPYLSFLFYWQVMEVVGNKPQDWINSAHTKYKNKLYLPKESLKILNIGSKSLGYYFLDDRRNAIAHINRKKPNKTVLKLDTLEENVKSYVSVRIIEEFAKVFIKEHLKMNKRMFLIRTRKFNGFPMFADEDFMRQNGGRMAYDRVSFNDIRKHKSYY